VNDQVKKPQLFDIVVDGRDMGTAVFPNAQLKIFLVADPWERRDADSLQGLDQCTDRRRDRRGDRSARPARRR